MVANWVSNSLKNTLAKLDQHDPHGYIRKRKFKLKREYGNRVLVVTGNGVLAAGSNLDIILEKVDLESADEKVIAGTVDSILGGRYVWLKNEYAATPADIATRHSYFAAKDAANRVNQQLGVLPSKLLEKIRAGAANEAVLKAVKADKRARSNVYHLGRGYTARDFAKMKPIEY